MSKEDMGVGEKSIEKTIAKRTTAAKPGLISKKSKT